MPFAWSSVINMKTCIIVFLLRLLLFFSVFFSTKKSRFYVLYNNYIQSELSLFCYFQHQTSISISGEKYSSDNGIELGYKDNNFGAQIELNGAEDIVGISIALNSTVRTIGWNQKKKREEETVLIYYYLSLFICSSTASCAYRIYQCILSMLNRRIPHSFKLAEKSWWKRTRTNKTFNIEF